ncbi:hypothetical protein JJB07_01575 [Tumebacillus sp. ITR2]|uniref:Uncharacterized protein n=1 Tax=Tumebacillus amylolyticus TaxID=2801339 RepID=A0ABS1J4X1_9BACL|nr:hypothetical protein [Tumebacillus amylolyticus]MBL0385323.1 hypothetical protein [Tumebacillus amylolyticus]
MAGSKKKGRKTLEKRVRTLQACLATLESSQPTYETTKRILEAEIELAKAELKTAPKAKAKSSPTKKSAGKSLPAAKPKSKRSPLPGGASFPSFQLPNPKSPTFAEDSMKHLGTLRNHLKKYHGYMSRADQMFDALHGVGTHLHKEGVLPKVIGGKFKDMTAGEWSTLLMALMNSPLAGFLLGGGGNSGGSEQSEEKQEDGQ